LQGNDTMDCPTLNQLRDFLRGIGSEGLADHIDNCPVCQRVIATLPDPADDGSASEARTVMFVPAPTAEEVSRAMQASQAPPVPVRSGQRIGNYVLQMRLGKPSGQGEVWLARHHQFPDMVVAVKLLRRDRAGAMDLERFRREIEVGGRMMHPHAVQVYD